MESYINEIVDCMATSAHMRDIQIIQTRHRVNLARFWGISSGDKILEVGCGQGDTTAVLAHFVGETGLVHGVDIGSPDYGAPITVGASAGFLMKSRLGKQIKMEFNTNLLTGTVDFPENTFDSVVLSHMSWYLHSHDELTKLLQQLRKWSRSLLFAEWDSRITALEQLPHFLAALIQAQYECFKTDSAANIRTLITPTEANRIVEDAGWRITKQTTLESSEMQDGEWEVGQTLSAYEDELNAIVDSMPAKLKTLIRSEVDLLRQMKQDRAVRPLSTYALVAH